MKCPECSSSNLVKFGKKFIKLRGSNTRVLKQQYQCKNCGRITINPEEEINGGENE